MFKIISLIIVIFTVKVEYVSFTLDIFYIFFKFVYTMIAEKFF